ncbi:MAG: STAS domain-containing protein [Alphaproteobacteria bacterium]|nr:STAS domain-containing protein [Alphaproteobacteria bacterium]
MEIIKKTVGGSVVLAPVGRIEMTTADPFREQVMAALEALGGGGAVVVDCAHLDYVSSAGLRALMIASKSAKAAGKGLAVAAMQPVVREIFQISRFDLVIACFETVREALGKLDPAALDGAAGEL